MGDERLQTWLKNINWSFNPFVLDIYAEYMVGFDEYVSKLNSAIEQNQKYMLVTAPTGSGKTMLMNYLYKNQINNILCIFVPKPPQKAEEFAKIIEAGIKEDKAKSQNIIAAFFQRLLSFLRKEPEITLYNLNTFIEKNSSGKKLLLLIDEAHETDIETLEWIRTITDTTPNMNTVLSGLPVLKKERLKQLETFMQRISLDISLEPLNKNQTIELIKRRINVAKGNMLDPFTTDCIELIHKQSGGFPRETIKICNDLINKAVNNNISLIDASCLEDKKQEEKSVVSLIDSLTDKQKDIIELVQKNEKITPSALAKSADAGSYKSKTHALRALNNLLKRLETMGLLERQKAGRTYAYKLTSKARNAMTEA
ncbi:MAG: AAA family ATPase [Candidatus Aenigmarchaeota archaeon]|nr:AAA family ATPase [Candidatus Aenigmarchaeota archaeon]MCK5177244.1 AAA family ATPase [Candidatus Aenigmarchaeota archaeon]